VHQTRENEFIEIGTGEPIESENLMEFRLLYGGQILGAGKSKTRADIKHAIRRELHPQLRRLWSTKSGLASLACYRYFPQWYRKHQGEEDIAAFTDENRRKRGIEALADQWSRCGFRFVPLVTSEFALRCEVNILFLRPEERHLIMQCGDLDARVKTIFDALRIPDNLEEAGGIGPQEDENPFFCLLSDDKLISSLSVTTDELLALPKERDVKANDAFIVMHVKVNHQHPGTFDQWFA